jgi:hypothetical protein
VSFTSSAEIPILAPRFRNPFLAPDAGFPSAGREHVTKGHDLSFFEGTYLL